MAWWSRRGRSEVESDHAVSKEEAMAKSPDELYKAYGRAYSVVRSGGVLSDDIVSGQINFESNDESAQHIAAIALGIDDARKDAFPRTRADVLSVVRTLMG
jgi:hypothetical protein